MSHPNHAPAMTWHQHLKDVHEHLKKTNPNATLKKAMLEARGSYRAMKDRLYDARQNMVAIARGRRRKVSSELSKADRIEAVSAADVLSMMRHDDIPRKLTFH